MGLWGKLWRTNSSRWTHGFVGDSRPVSPQTTYVTMRLRSLHLPFIRRGLTHFYGVVHAFTSFAHLGSGDAQFQFVSTPSKLAGVDAANHDKVVTVDKIIAGPVPYRGGAVTAEVGLFSVAARDLAAPFLDTLEDVSRALGISFISKATDVLRAIDSGIDRIVRDGSGSTLEIGLSVDFLTLNEGTYVVIARQADPNSLTTMSVNAAGELLENGRPVTDPYLVLSISSAATRDDWMRIPDLLDAYHRLEQPFRQGSVADIGPLLHAFKITLLLSPDLLRADAIRVFKAVKDEFDELVKATLTSSGRDVEFPPLAKIAPRIDWTASVS